MTTFIWGISRMLVRPVEGDLTNVVVEVDWNCSATNGTQQPFVTGVSKFTAVGDPFTPYDQLTQEQVLEWCWTDGIDKAQVEAQVQAKLDALSAPPVEDKPLPWSPSSE